MSPSGVSGKLRNKEYTRELERVQESYTSQVLRIIVRRKIVWLRNINRAPNSFDGLALGIVVYRYQQPAEQEDTVSE